MTSLPNALHAWQTAGFAQALKAEIEPLGAAKIGVFFTEIVASCGCGAEPMEQNAYCEMRLRIAKATAEAALSVPRIRPQASRPTKEVLPIRNSSGYYGLRR